MCRPLSVRQEASRIVASSHLSLNPNLLWSARLRQRRQGPRASERLQLLEALLNEFLLELDEWLHRFVGFAFGFLHACENGLEGVGILLLFDLCGHAVVTLALLGAETGKL